MQKVYNWTIESLTIIIFNAQYKCTNKDLFILLNRYQECQNESIFSEHEKCELKHSILKCWPSETFLAKTWIRTRVDTRMPYPDTSHLSAEVRLRTSWREKIMSHKKSKKNIFLHLLFSDKLRLKLVPFSNNVYWSSSLQPLAFVEPLPSRPISTIQFIRYKCPKKTAAEVQDIIFLK